jgi:AAA domain
VDASGGPDGDGLELTLDPVSWLRQVIGEHQGARLLIVDTLSASATRPITTHTGLKAMLKPLNTLAKDTGVAVVLTAHTRKISQGLRCQVVWFRRRGFAGGTRRLPRRRGCGS